MKKNVTFFTLTKRLFLVVLLLGGVTLNLKSQISDLNARYTKEHPLVYIDAWDLWPYVFLDEAGHPTGYNVDLLKMILEELKIPYEIHLKPTSKALDDLFNGRSDLMLGMVASFHDHDGVHYGKSVIQLFTHSVAHVKGESHTVRRLEDLANEQVVVHDGSFSHHLMIDHGWDHNATPQGDMDKAIQLVSANGSGQVLWNTMSLKWLIHKYHTDNLVLEPVDMPSGDYRFMSSDEQLLRALDDTYAKLKAEDRLHLIEQKWFYPEESLNSGPPRWTWLLVAAIGAIALILAVASIIYHFRERRATHEGRLRNARLALILKACQVTIWTYDVTKKTFMSYGNDAHLRKNIGRNEFAARFNGDDYQRLAESVIQLVNRERTHDRLQLRGKDMEGKQMHTYIVNVSVLHSENGQPTVIIGNEIDVTEEYERQQRASQMMHRYQAIFNNAMVDMVYYDSKGRIIRMNGRAQNTFKMPIEAVKAEGVHLSDILSPEDFDISDFAHRDRFYSTLFIDYSKEKQLESRKREGSIAYELQLVPVYSDAHQLLGAFGTGREVTEVARNFQRARQGVRQLRDAMRELTDNIDNINYALQVGGVRMVTYSPQTHMLTINHRMHEAQYILTQQRCISLTADESMRQVMRGFRMMDSRRNMAVSCEVRSSLRLPGGKNLWLQLLLFPTLADDGTVTEYSGICRDTTELKHTEAMLQLETEKAQEIEQVKIKFLHNMCYEIRTPLDTVVKSAEKFELQHSPEDEEQYIKEIKENSTYLLNLINDILFLSRLDAKMVEINIEPTDFAQTFESRCEQAWANGRREGVKYIVENQYNHLVVNIDETNIGRIIHQIIENSVNYTTQGYVRAHYEYIGGRLIIVVEDTGKGIPADKLPHIFERFSDTSANMQGTGLGLPICKELVTQLGGTIDVSSEVEKGTLVWVLIPCEASLIEHKKEN
jgi:PAS domain S-box-containing protein